MDIKDYWEQYKVMIFFAVLAAVAYIVYTNRHSLK